MSVPEIIHRFSFIVGQKKQKISSENNEQRTTNRSGFTLINRGTIKASPTGFTLIELMIAITIIAVLSTVAFVSYSKAQQLGRDAKRKQDLRTIAISLELYKQRNGRYPCAEPWQDSNDTQPWIRDSLLSPNTICDNLKPAFDTNYISALPKDPRSTGSSPSAGGNFVYGYRAFECGTDGSHYILIAELENTSDPDRAILTTPWCGGTYADITSATNKFIIAN